MVTVPLDDARAAALLGRLARELRRFPGELAKIHVNALNSVGRKVRNKAISELTKRYAAKPDDIKSKVALFRASPGKPLFMVRGVGRPIHLYKWPKQMLMLDGQDGRMHRGVNTQILKGGGYKVVKGGFVARSSRNKERMIFSRKGGKRYPIKGLYGPSMIGYFTNDENLEMLTALARNSLEPALQRTAIRRLNKLAGAI